MNDVEVALAAASAGARIVRAEIGTAVKRIDKGGGDFATTVDVEAEAAMIALLRRERPEDMIRAEESGTSGTSDTPRRWLIDPLCGTLNYAVQMRVIAVNVALTQHERTLCAAVADPFSEEVFWSDGERAYVRTGDDDAPLSPSASSDLVDLNLDPPFPSAPGFCAVRLAADPAFAARFRPRVVSSSLALTWVAAGRRAAYVTDGNVAQSVHFNAGLAICASAGCVISDLRGGEPPRAAGVLVAADRATHTSLLELVLNQAV
jgi:myo-inositol-1(or 4)-monophosphatase